MTESKYKDIVRSQYTEILRLQAENEHLKQVAEYQQSLSMKRHFEIKRLRDELAPILKAEAVAAFAKNLKQSLPTVLHPYIDTVARETIGDE